MHATKHAVLAVTETLAQELAFAEADIKVSVLCPAAVNTRVMDAARNRPRALGEQAPSSVAGKTLEDAYRRGLASATDPARVAALVLEAIREERFYILPHAHVRDMARARGEAIANDAYPAPPPDRTGRA